MLQHSGAYFNFAVTLFLSHKPSSAPALILTSCYFLSGSLMIMNCFYKVEKISISAEEKGWSIYLLMSRWIPLYLALSLPMARTSALLFENRFFYLLNLFQLCSSPGIPQWKGQSATPMSPHHMMSLVQYAYSAQSDSRCGYEKLVFCQTFSFLPSSLLL